MFLTSKKNELMALVELHYIYGIDFPFLHKKPKEKPHRIKQPMWKKAPKNHYAMRIWRQR